MLDNLNAIKWSRLSHAYGKASNVPKMLRGLSSANRNRRENAIDGLFWSIYHQGTIYDATAPAVPFLIELARSPEIQDRHRILELLEAIAGGYGYVQVHGRLDSPAQQATEEFRQTLGQEHTCQQAVRDAVWRGWADFLTLLRDPEKKLRRGARKVIATLLTQPRSALPGAIASLVDALPQLIPEERGGILRALAEAIRSHADAGAAQEAALDHREHEIELFNDSSERELETPEWLLPSPEELAWSREALTAFWQAWPTCAELLGRGSVPEREGALFLQALLLQFAEKAMPERVARERPREQLLVRWTEQLPKAETRLQVNLAFALAAVGPREERVHRALDELLRTTRSRLVGYVAALKRIDLTSSVPDRGMRLLVAVDQQGRQIYEQLRRLPRWGNYLAMPRLQKIGPLVIERYLARFIEGIRRTGESGGLGSGRTCEVLRLAFANGPLSPGASLTDAQRRLLLAAAENGFFWGRLSNNNLNLDRLGLPERRRELRQFLARPGEPVSRPSNDPEEASVVFERLVRRALPFQDGLEPSQPEEPDPRAPFRVIQESVEELRRIEETYRPKDRPRIETLEVCGYACDALLALTPLCPNLRELDLAWGEATDKGLAHLARLTRLERLDLHENWITDAGLAHLAGLVNLRELALGFTDITDEGLRHLGGLAELRKMHLGGTRIRGPGLGFLACLPHLEELWLCGDHLTDAATPLLGQFQVLKKLTYGGKHLTGRGLETWHELTSLERVDFHQVEFAEETLRLPSLPALAALDFWKAKLTDRCIQTLPVLSALQSLGLYNAPVTDAALQGIERFATLRRINLSGTKVTDKVVPHLLRLQRLEWVGLFDTEVSESAVAQLQEAFPEGAFGR